MMVPRFRAIQNTEWFTGPNMERSLTVASDGTVSRSLSLETDNPLPKGCVNSTRGTNTLVVDHAVKISSRWMKVKRIVSVVLLAQF